MRLDLNKTTLANILLSSAVLGVVLFWPSGSKAFTLYDQIDVSDTKSDCVDVSSRCMTGTSSPFGTTSGFEQYLGYGLNGNVSSVSFYVADDQWSVGGQPTMKVGIACYTSASVSASNYDASCSSSAYTISGVPRTNVKTLVNVAIHSFSFNPLKYYTLAFQCTSACSGGLGGNTNDKFYVYGSAITSSTDYYENGDFERDDRSDLGIDDIYFSVMSSQSNVTSYSVSRILRVYSPTSNQVIPCTTDYCDVLFYFDWYNRSTYDKVGVIISDVTLGATLDTVDFEHDVAISGLGSYQEIASMHSDRLYSFEPYLRDSSGALVQISGGVFYFRVGSQEDNIVTFDEVNIGSQSNGYDSFDVSSACNKYFPDTGTWLSISSYGNAFGRGICNGLGYTFIPASGSFTRFANDVFIVRNYFPVSTITSVYDFSLDILTDSNIASTSQYASLTLENMDFDTRVSHSVDITIFRMASLSEYIPQSSITLVRNVFLGVLYIGFSFGMFFALRKVFKV